jgi:hypothetical protein
MNETTVELVQSDIWVLWHPTKIFGPKIYLFTKIKPEYSDILYNLTHFPGPLVCRIRQVLTFLYNLTHFPGPLVCHIGTKYFCRMSQNSDVWLHKFHCSFIHNLFLAWPPFSYIFSLSLKLFRYSITNLFQ